MAEISDVTRQNIADDTVLNSIHYEGKLNEPDFLSRIFDLQALPSRDPMRRYNNAYDDIYQHTVNNNDYSSNWIYSDPRINLSHCPDEVYLKFLTETIHPIVRSNQTEIDKLLQIYNRHLIADGFEIVKNGNISGKSLFSWSRIHRNQINSTSRSNKTENQQIILKPLERINLIRDIAVGLQQRMTFEEIDAYLKEYDIKWNGNSRNSKKTYIQSVLDDKIPSSKIIIIGKELGIYKSDELIAEEESHCWSFGFFKMFISHLTVNKESATNLKKCLSEYAISGFVAHEDIEPSKEWMQEIERALFSMDCLCAIVTPKFIESLWCDQEVGVAVGRKVLVIPIRKGADPYGLFGKYQGIQSNKKDAYAIAAEIFKIVSTNEKSKTAYSEIVRNLVLNARNIEEGLKWLNLLDKMPSIDSFVVSDLHSKFVSNSNLNDKIIFAIANRIFSKYNLSKMEASAFVNPEIDTDDLPF